MTDETFTIVLWGFCIGGGLIMARIAWAAICDLINEDD